MIILSKFFLYAGIFLIPFYVFPSGFLQPSYILLLLFLFIWVLFKKGKLGSEAKGFLNYFFPFYVYSLVVNLVYMFLYQEVLFLDFSKFLLFNLLISLGLISFTSFNCKFGGNTEVEVLRLMVSILVLMLILWLLNLGRYSFYPRYNGFFNDPNQMAFFLICSASIALVFVRSIWVYFLVLLLSMFLILLTVSRSALIGMLPLILNVFFLSGSSNNRCSNNRSRRKLILSKLVFVFIFLPILLLNMQYLLSIEYIDVLKVRFVETDFSEQSDIRGYGRLVKYAEYLLFGAGQGLDMRFDTNLEIHSTWAAFLFYYGVIGLLGFVIPLLKIFKSLNMNHKLLFLAPMLYSFSTFGVRTPIFWIFLSVFYCLSKDIIVTIKKEIDR